MRAGVEYGPDGNDFVGTLVVPDDPDTPEGNARRNALRRMVGLKAK